MHCYPSETVLEVKAKLQTLSDFSIHTQCLILLPTYQLLDDAWTLAEYKVNHPLSFSLGIMHMYAHTQHDDILCVSYNPWVMLFRWEVPFIDVSLSLSPKYMTHLIYPLIQMHLRFRSFYAFGIIKDLHPKFIDEFQQSFKWLYYLQIFSIQYASFLSWCCMF